MRSVNLTQRRASKLLPPAFAFPSSLPTGLRTWTARQMCCLHPSSPPAHLPRNDSVYSPHNPLWQFHSQNLGLCLRALKKNPYLFGVALCTPPHSQTEEGERERGFHATETHECFRAAAPNPGRHQRLRLTAAASNGGDKTKPPQEPQVSPRPGSRRGNECPRPWYPEWDPQVPQIKGRKFNRQQSWLKQGLLCFLTVPAAGKSLQPCY